MTSSSDDLFRPSLLWTLTGPDGGPVQPGDTELWLLIGMQVADWEKLSDEDRTTTRFLITWPTPDDDAEDPALFDGGHVIAPANDDGGADAEPLLLLPDDPGQFSLADFSFDDQHDLYFMQLELDRDTDADMIEIHVYSRGHHVACFGQDLSEFSDGPAPRLQVVVDNTASPPDMDPPK
jgi:hypothetical protein